MRKAVFPLVVAIVALNAQLSFAQRAGEVEVQVGPGYIYDAGEGPSTVALNLGGIIWFSKGVGIGGHLAAGLADDHFTSPSVASDRTFLGPGKARHSSVTLQARSFAGRNELEFGIGISRVSYEYQTILTGIRHAAGEVEPITPRLLREHLGNGAIRAQFLIGREVTKVLTIKAGVIVDLTEDVRPVQSVVLLSRRFGGL
jgi:hypothetical protein